MEINRKSKGSTPIIREMNNTIINFTTLAWNYYNDCIKKQQHVKAEAIRSGVLQKDKPNTSLLEAFAYQIEKMKSRVGFDIAPSTVKKYETAERKIRQFLKEEFDRGDIALYEVNHKFITEMYLKIKKQSITLRIFNRI